MGAERRGNRPGDGASDRKVVLVQSAIRRSDAGGTALRLPDALTHASPKGDNTDRLGQGGDLLARHLAVGVVSAFVRQPLTVGHRVAGKIARREAASQSLRDGDRWQPLSRRAPRITARLIFRPRYDGG